MSDIKFTVYREDGCGDEVEIEVYIDADYIPESRGSRDEYGQLNEPDCGAGWEITSATDEHGKHIDLTKREIEEIEKQLDCKREEAIAGAKISRYLD